MKYCVQACKKNTPCFKWSKSKTCKSNYLPLKSLNSKYISSHPPFLWSLIHIKFHWNPMSISERIKQTRNMDRGVDRPTDSLKHNQEPTTAKIFKNSEKNFFRKVQAMMVNVSTIDLMNFSWFQIFY